MSNIVLYDPDSSVVANRATNYLLSVNTPDYTSNPDALINPDLSSVSGIAFKYWMYDGTGLVEMPASDRTSVDNLLIAKNNPEKNFKVITYTTNKRLKKETWYEVDNGDESYSVKSEEYEYFYQGSSLVSKVTTTFGYDESELSVETFCYYKNDLGQFIEKKETQDV